MRLNAKGIIFIFTFLYFSKQTKRRDNYKIVFVGEKKCKFCKDVLKVCPYYIIISKTELHELLEDKNGSLKDTEPNTRVSDSLNNFTLINEELINEELNNEELNNEEMKEFHSLWIYNELYPSGYDIIFSLFFHDICFFKLMKNISLKNANNGAEDSSKFKLEDLISIITPAELSELIFINSEDQKMKENLAKFILYEPLKNNFHQLMNKLSSSKKCFSTTRDDLKKLISHRPDLSLKCITPPFICEINKLKNDLIYRISQAINIIINVRNIKLDFHKDDLSFIYAADAYYRNRKDASNYTIIIRSCFLENNFEKLFISLHSIFQLMPMNYYFAYIIFIFDKIILNFKSKINPNDQTNFSLTNIIGNSSLLYLMLDLSDLGEKYNGPFKISNELFKNYKELLKKFFQFKLDEKNFCLLSKFIRHFFLYPLGLTELTMLIKFFNDEYSNEILPRIAIKFDKGTHKIYYNEGDVQNLIKRELIKKDFSYISLIPFDWGTRKAYHFKPSKGSSLLIQQNGPSEQTQSGFLQQPIEGITSQSTLTHHIIFLPNKYSLHQAFKEKLQKISSEIDRPILFDKELEHLLSFIDIKLFSFINDDDQKTLFDFFILYFQRNGCLPENHYKLCLLKFENILHGNFKNSKLVIWKWVEAILSEEKFISNFPLELFLQNIIFMYKNRINRAKNFQFFFRSSRNMYSITTLANKVNIFLDCNTRLYYEPIYGPLLSDSLLAFRSFLMASLGLHHLIEGPASSSRGRPNRKRTHDAIQ